MLKLNKKFTLLLFAALFAFILGEKFMLIDRCGSDLPFWDQWDAEGDYLYRPYLEGRLTAHDLFSPHNEHRIFFTRLLALGLFELNDHQWDARVELLVNTMLHTAVALMLASLALRVLPVWPATGYVILIATFFSSPVSWENTLAGFQSQFYFLLIFSALHVAGTLFSRPRSLAWWLAPLAGAAALLSMASGLLSATAILATVGLRTLHERKLTRDDLWVLSSNVTLCVVGWLLKVHVSYHDGLKAAGLVPLLDAWLHQLAWPVKNLWMAPLGLVAPALLVWAFFRRRIGGPIVLILVGACTWTWLQTAAIAYARGAVEHGYAPRYTDLLAISVLLNLLAFAYLANQVASRRLRLWAGVGVATFAGIALWGLGRETIVTEQGVLRQLPEINTTRITSVRNYILLPKPSFFTKIPWAELPYPSAERLAGLLDQPVLREILPNSVRPPVPLVADSNRTHGFDIYQPDGQFGPVPRGLSAWVTLTPEGGGAASTARFSSRMFSVDHARVGFFVASGASDQEIHFFLVDEKGLKHEPLESNVSARQKWKRINFRVFPGRYCLEVNRVGVGWFAFSQPMTDTQLSHYAVKVAKLGPWLLTSGCCLGIAALLVLRRSNRDHNRQKSVPTTLVIPRV